MAAESNELTIFSVNKKSVLGTGGFATVYSGLLLKDSSAIAVKRIQLSLSGADLHKREKKAMESLNHPNVLKLLGTEDADDFRYFALELGSATLKDYCEGTFKTAPTPLDGLLQMSRGVDHIHANNFVHRDIKPENILIFADTPSRVILKIADFGLTKETTESGKYSVSKICGSESYIAPEFVSIQDKPETYTPRAQATQASDVFSLGCVFYMFLTKKHPFSPTAFLNIQKGCYNLSGLPKYHYAVHLIESMIRSKPNERPKMPEIVQHFLF